MKLPATSAGSVGATEHSAGPPQASSAPLGGSEPRAAGSVGAPTPPPGRPKAGSAPSGGSEPREAGSVGATFTFPVRVYWEDTDAGGIVFYANYLKFFERARTEWLRSLGVEQQRLREEAGGMFVVTDTQLRYLRPARLDDFLLVTARVQEAGRASFTMVQTALLKPQHSDTDTITDATVLCQGTVRIGWVDSQTLRPQRIPVELLNRLSSAAPVRS